jgi:hypothetical protein
MPTPAAAQAETAAPAAPAPAALPESTSAAASKFVAAKEAAAKPAETKVEAKKLEIGEARKPRIDPNLVKREREATTALQRAEAIESKFKPLTEALAKRDFRTALELVAKDHGANFADFVAILENKDTGETLEQKAERIARETIEKAKAQDAADAKERERVDGEAQTKLVAEKLVRVQGMIQEKAESDPERWDLASLNPVVTKDDAGRPVLASEYAWLVIEAEHGATGKKLSFEEALDIVELKLREKRTSQRAKSKGAQTASASGNAHNEADGQARGGRAAEPSISNRTTAAPGARPARDPNAPVRFDKSAVDEAIARAGIRLPA